MEIRSQSQFAATPQQVFAMLTDEAYLTEVCRASQATSHQVAVEGTTTRTRRELAAPAAAAKFTGPTLTVSEEIAWGPEQADGSRIGELALTVAGQPVTMKGQVHLSPAGEGTVVDVVGDLKVNVPLVGRKLEQSAAPAIAEGIEVQQHVGNRWLAERS